MSADPASDLIAFIDASPSPWHAVAECRRRLDAAGFRELDEGSSWALNPRDRVYVVRGGTTILAAELGSGAPEDAGFRIVGAHTDSPCLRWKPKPEVVRAGTQLIGVEIYGGVLLHTWLDRDLIFAGRVFVRGPTGPTAILVRSKDPVARVPSLAIHLQRAVNTDGLVLNPQQHMPPVISLESSGSLDARALLAAAAETVVRSDEILAVDIVFADGAPGSRVGTKRELLSVPRLDNLASCHAALSALIASKGSAGSATRIAALFDHEEVGSRSAQGAGSNMLGTFLERIVLATSKADDALPRAAHRSFFVSADMAHGIHPNYADKHEPLHAPMLGRGPVIKTNANQSYATDAEGAARVIALAKEGDIPLQDFVVRTDLGCGSTIGPMSAAALGIRTIDIGSPMWSMHSAREMAAAADVAPMIALLSRHFGS